MDIPTVVLGKEIQPFHRELLNLVWQPGWEGGFRGEYICMVDSLHCSPETTTTLLIGYTQYKIKSLKLKKKRNSAFWFFLKLIRNTPVLYHLSLLAVTLSPDGLMAPSRICTSLCS